MNTPHTLLARNHAHNWHPASQMKTQEIFKPLILHKARDAYIELDTGKKIIDAISSWWCKSLGHNHPRLKKALYAQLDRFEHVIFAGTTHDVIVNFAEQLARLCPPLNKVFYASDGASAVEIALKMSLHSRIITGETGRSQFIALENGYHGETLGALSVSDSGQYRAPYEALLFKTHFIKNIPLVSTTSDPLWQDCSTRWPAIEKSLEPYADTTTALILEPIVQGAAGMQIYSQDFLRRLRAWTHQHGIHLIADEIMTGIGRTGKMLAVNYAEIIPDFICLSKGLTSGWLPLSVVLIHEKIYDAFYAEPELGKNFLHSHTYSGNALAVAVASEVLAIFEAEKICDHVPKLSSSMLTAIQEIADSTGQLAQVRGIGGIVAADIIDFAPHSGSRFSEIAAHHGALLRPIGNTLYWLPPLNIKLDLIEELKGATERTLREFVGCN